MTEVPEDWAFHYRGLTIGGETDYCISGVDGLFGLPDIESTSRKRSGSHGFITGRQLAGKRVGTIDIAYGSDTSDATELFLARDALLAAFHALNYEEPLTFGFPGLDPRMINCRVTKLDAPAGRSWVFGFAESMRLEVESADFPFWQSAEENSASGGAQLASNGRIYPLVFPRLYGTLAGGSIMNTNNEGNADAYWTAEIHGPCLNPSLSLPTEFGTHTLKVLTTLNAGEYMVLDRRRELVLIQGTSPRYDLLAPGAEWFDLPEGESQMYYSSENLQGLAVVRWRDTWW